MRRLGQLTLAACSAAFLIACGNASSPTPAGPTPTPTPQPSKPTVVSITVAGAPGPTASTFQLTASAKMSDQTTQDVTHSATWDSSNAQIATVASDGVVTIVADGSVDIRATYQSVSGSAHFTVSVPKSVFTITGVVVEAAPNQHPIAGARVQLIGGDHVFTDSNGAYTFTGFQSGKTLLEFSANGYQTWETEFTVSGNMQVNATLYPTPPTNSAGTAATARCNDGTWSWAQTRADACTANGGVAYTVCPGPLCGS